jgi:lipid-A-disaccharide synthase-like uncharacterized protein
MDFDGYARARAMNDFLEVLLQPMAAVGVVGQAMFSARFLVQWLVSEKKKESTIPIAFWYLSMAGGTLTLVYAIWRRDPIFTVAQASGLLVYARNLMLIRARKGANDAADPS